MTGPLKPVPDGATRADIAEQVRLTAATNSKDRAPRLPQRANGDLAKAMAGGNVTIAAFGTFTKGLTHDNYGRVRAADLQKLVDELNQKPSDPVFQTQSPFPGVYDPNLPTGGRPVSFGVPLFNGPYVSDPALQPRGWESPLAGHTFDTQGDDADGVGMRPAPQVGSDELTAEMAEVYSAALLRDKKFSDWATDPTVAHLIGEMNKLPYFASEEGLDKAAKMRRAARFKNNVHDVNSVFRGSGPRAKEGPYISQFMLIGNSQRTNPGASPNTAKTPKDGVILYGLQDILQQFIGHEDYFDHMTTWPVWRDVQNAANRGDLNRYNRAPRFISTPRDLATYVHFDALYQAYLNAVLILNSMVAQTDVGLPEGPQLTRTAFATYGGPHILSLVTEVATRALKAVRRQKFNIHLRSRPEVMGAALALASAGGNSANALGPFKGDFDAMATALVSILDEIKKHNKDQNQRQGIDNNPGDPIDANSNALLPMAFPEGSPMHAAYGAGHATVAGACVTVVKAFYEMFTVDESVRGQIPLYDVVTKSSGYPALKFPTELFTDEKILSGPNEALKVYQADPNDPTTLSEVTSSPPLTVQGELDKLAANISIGRNFAGVHYYTDYYDSVRMGERIAVSMLQDQMLTYREPVTMRFKSFDGDYVMIAGTGGSVGRNDALVFVWDKNQNGGTETDFHNWYNRHR
ncbi:MAG: bromoperoxidase [Pseudomonadota bacterium]